MKTVLIAVSLLFAATVRAETTDENASAVTSSVEATAAGDLYMLHSLEIDAPVADVWRAYTTEEGWRSWVAPVIEIDFRVGGLIQSHYTADASIGDPGTIRLHIVNYVPERLLTLQAEITDYWPEFLKSEQDRMFNVVVFDALSDNRTRVESYGLGYTDNQKHRDLMDFFVAANEQHMIALKNYVEQTTD